MPSLRHAVADRLGVDARRRCRPGRRRRGRGRVPAACSSGGPAGRRGAGDEADRAGVGRAGRSSPALDRTPDEISAVLAALDGRWVPPGRAGPRPGAWPTCCRPGATSTPSTPRRCPAGWPGRSGQGLADRLLDRHLAEEGRYPRSGGAGRLGDRGHAHRRRRRGRGPGPAGRPPGLAGGVGAGDRAGADPGRGAGPAPGRRGRCASPASSGTPFRI